MSSIRTLIAAVVLLTALQSSRLFAQGNPIPLPVPLWNGEAPLAQGAGELDIPTLTPFIAIENPTKSAVIIAPGGGYSHLSMQKEGEDIARWLNAHGVAGFVLKYRLGPRYHHPAELDDAQRAIRMVRARAEEWGIDPQHVGMWGFSAGGHLAASAATLYDQGLDAASDRIDRQSSRPDFLILAYPVMTLSAPFVHRASRDSLLGQNPDPALLETLSPEKHVTANTPPSFLFATTDDATVSVMNSILFYSALVQAKVPAEMHLFSHGPHGVGLAPGYPDLSGWPELLASWMRRNGWMAPRLSVTAAMQTPQKSLCTLPCILN